MSKLYVGNLSPDVTEDALKNIFEENGVSCSNTPVVKKNGRPQNPNYFAFVDVEDQAACTLAIDKLNGYNLMGSVIVVEPQNPKNRGRRMSPSQNDDNDTQRNRVNIQVHNIPLDCPLQEIQKLLDTFGTVTSCEKGNEGKDGYSANANYEAPEQAQQAIKQLHRYKLEGYNSVLKVAYKNSLGRAARGRFNNRGGYPGNRNNGQNVDFPVRMLVPSDLVGAIIGKQGVTIKQITSDTNARVDIHRKENPGSTEKAVTIFGRPEDASNAGKEIMKVMAQENQNSNRDGGEMPLKLLAHNALVGRLIGKGGSSLKKIMEDSGARITISPLHELTIYNPERTVTIKGTVEQCCHAEGLITAKLRQAYEQYMHTLQPQQHNLFPGLNHMALFSGGPEMGGPPHNFHGPRHGLPGLHNYGPFHGGPGMQGGPDPNFEEETTYMFIPKDSVGAIIGVKGENIRDITRKVNAKIRIAQPESENAVERMVTVVGTPEAQWGAQFYIYDKIRSEGTFRQMQGENDHGEVHLRCELQVPGRLVGRIIGRKGVKVRELQRVTGSRVEVPRDNTEGAQNGDMNKEGGDQAATDKVVNVKVHGHFFANQAAQRRIRRMLAEFNNRPQWQQRPMRRGPQGERGPPHGGPPHGGPPHGERGPRQ